MIPVITEIITATYSTLHSMRREKVEIKMTGLRSGPRCRVGAGNFIFHA
jgi:hypothetical protein